MDFHWCPHPVYVSEGYASHMVLEVSWGKSGVGLLMLDVIIFLSIIYSCFTCTRFLHDGGKQLKLQEDNLIIDDSFWILTISSFMTLTC